MSCRSVVHAQKVSQSQLRATVLTAFPYFITANRWSEEAWVNVTLARDTHSFRMTADRFRNLTSLPDQAPCNVMPYERYKCWADSFSRSCLPREAEKKTEDPLIKLFQSEVVFPRGSVLKVSDYAPCIPLYKKAGASTPSWVAVLVPIRHQILLTTKSLRESVLEALGFDKKKCSTPAAFEVVAMALVAFEGGLESLKTDKQAAGETSAGASSIYDQVRDALDKMKAKNLTFNGELEKLYASMNFTCGGVLQAPWVEKARKIREKDKELKQVDEEDKIERTCVPDSGDWKPSWGDIPPATVFAKRTTTRGQ